LPLCPEGFADLGPIAVGATAAVRRIAKNGTSYALKRLHPHLSDQPDARALFEDEARIGSRLAHPCLVTVLSAGEDELGPYQIQEYAPGPTLAAVLAKSRPLPAEISARIAADVARGLSYAHSLTDEEGTALHLVHRDINPSNLIVTVSGQTRLIDFGVSHFRGARASPHAVRGTAAYLSPEQARGEPTSPASDLFSLGAIFFEMLTGTRAYGGPEPVALAAIGAGALPRLPASLPALSAAVLRALLAPKERRARAAQNIAAALAGQAAPHSEVTAFLKKLSQNAAP
jgi:eukaryotic-like serine/threonine-protein kinase